MANNCTKSNVALTALALYLLMLPALGQAHFPALFGKKFIRAEPVQQAEHPPSPTLQATPMDKADADAFRQQLAEQESLGGPYTEAVTDPLTSLARYHEDRGDYLEAEALYKRALHIVRVNDGLNSERQIPLVRDLLDLYLAAGDLQALDDRYDYFFRVYGSGQPPYTTLRKRASLEYLRWQRAAHSSGLDGYSNKRLVDMYQLNKQMLKTAAETPDVEQTWRHELVLSQIRNLYLLLGIPFYSGSTPQNDDQINVLQKLSLLKRIGFATGRNLLQDLIAQSEHLDPVARASLHLELGDWHQWNEHRPNADKEYAQVEQILLEAGEQDLLDQWLGAPVELPANDAFRQPRPPPGDASPVVATIHFDISARGHLSNVEASTQHSEDKAIGWRIKRMLKETHFRPRFAAGEAQATEQVTRQYQMVKH